MTHEEETESMLESRECEFCGDALDRAKIKCLACLGNFCCPECLRDHERSYPRCGGGEDVAADAALLDFLGGTAMKSRVPTDELAELRKDKARLDWLESRAKNVSWKHKAWLVRGGAPEIVSAEVGEKWPEGITQATARAALDAVMERSS